MIKKVCAYAVLAAIATGAFLVLKFVFPLVAVSSGSMEPTLPVGSRIIIADQSHYHRGDIITFVTDGRTVTHRLIDINLDGSYATKGDANLTPDVWSDPVTRSDVMGKVVYMTPIATADYWTSRRGIGVILCAIIMIAVTGLPTKDEETDDTQASENESAHTPV